ncbi:MAG: sensor histidine kinase [Candidatus Merdivicinus sp.]|jgi:two-component system sensor histidine kinase YesM
MFRETVKESGEIIPLRRELEILQNYVTIQMMRFESRLQLINHIPEEYEEMKVPKFCLQPLVENAIKCALDQNDEDCIVTLSLSVREDMIQLQVKNTGSTFDLPEMEKMFSQSQNRSKRGIGLKNIHTRLGLIFGNRYGLTFMNQDGCAVVCINMPASALQNQELLSSEETEGSGCSKD